ncbi:unnamed protein product, partial [Closterium sp. NIES-54]
PPRGYPLLHVRTPDLALLKPTLLPSLPLPSPSFLSPQPPHPPSSPPPPFPSALPILPLALEPEFFIFAIACRKTWADHRMLHTCLFLLIWGEAANVRFLPECLCYLFHQ